MLLPQQLKDLQNEIYILEFEISTTRSLWSNFFKFGEYDAGSYYAKKKLEDHG